MTAWYATRPHRFTPAYAGNTIQGERLPAHAEVHPRIRGEYRIYREVAWP